MAPGACTASTLGRDSEGYPWAPGYPGLGLAFFWESGESGTVY